MQESGDFFRGLGFLDSRQDVLTLEFTVPLTNTSDRDAGSHEKKRRDSKQGKRTSTEKTFEVLIAQDKTALRSRKGDTGSVLWRARYACDTVVKLAIKDSSHAHLSYEFGQHMLNQISSPKSALLDPSKLAGAHVLELGCVKSYSSHRTQLIGHAEKSWDRAVSHNAFPFSPPLHRHRHRRLGPPHREELIAERSAPRKVVPDR